MSLIRGVKLALKRSHMVFVWTFAIFGFFDLIGRGIVYPFTGMIFGYVRMLPNDYSINDIVVSGDGAYKAIIYVWSGPAFNAGCDKIVAVVNAMESINTSWANKNIVYKAACDEFFSMNWEPPADGRVTPRLRIVADAGKGEFMSRSAMAGRVGVAYNGDP